MERKLWHLIKRFWLPIGIIGALIVVLGAILLLQDRNGDDNGDQVNPPLVDTSTDSIEGGFVSDDGDSLLLISLSEGQARVDEIEPIPTATGEPLPEDEIERILARLPELIIDPEEQEDFKLPLDSLPPPRTGETIDEVFPRIDVIEPEPVDTGPLQMLRYSQKVKFL